MVSLWPKTLTVWLIAVALLVSSLTLAQHLVTPAYSYSPELNCNRITTTTYANLTPTPANFPKPVYLTPYPDPLTGAKVTRITNSEAWGVNSCRHFYSKQPAWNADQSLIYLGMCKSRILDGNNYQVVDNLNLSGIKMFVYHDENGNSEPNGDYPIWHPTEPDNMVFFYYNVDKPDTPDNLGYFGKYNVRTKTREVLATSNELGYKRLWMGNGEGNLSNDGRYILLYNLPNKKAFVFDLVNKEKLLPELDISQFTSIDWLSMSPSGKYVIGNVGFTADVRDTIIVYEFRYNQQTQSYSFVEVSRQTDWACPSHFDITIDTDGREVAIGVCKPKLISPGNPRRRGYVKYDLATGKITYISDIGSSHTSTRNIFNTGYALGSYHQGTAFEDEVLAYKLDGSVIERWAWIPVMWGVYESEPQAVMSPYGDKAIVASNWIMKLEYNEGGSFIKYPVEDYYPVDAYVIEPCGYSENNNPPPSVTPITPPITPKESVTPPVISITPKESIIPPTIPANCTLRKQGDANCDNIIDSKDFVIWKCEISNKGTCPSPVSEQSANFDGLNGTDLNDFEIWRRHR